MKVSVDTNVLIRATVLDDPAQANAAKHILREATVLAVGLPCLCEFVWVLRSVYSFSRAEIALAIRALMNASNLAADRTAIEAGLSFLEAGADFADGVIAYEGRRLGGETFVSFDRKAITLLQSQGHPTRLLR